MTEKKTKRDTRGDTDDNTQVDDAGVPGQIQYPDRTVDAERAAAYAAGKEDTLYDEDDPRFYSGWQNPADNDTRSEEQREKNETEPEEMRHEG